MIILIKFLFVLVVLFAACYISVLSWKGLKFLMSTPIPEDDSDE